MAINIYLCLEQNGWTRLHNASYEGRPVVVKKLLAAGVNVNTANKVSRVLLCPVQLRLHIFYLLHSQSFVPTTCTFQQHGQCW